METGALSGNEARETEVSLKVPSVIQTLAVQMLKFTLLRVILDDLMNTDTLMLL